MRRGKYDDSGMPRVDPTQERVPNFLHGYALCDRCYYDDEFDAATKGIARLHFCAERRGGRVCDEQEQVDRRNGKRGWWTESDNAAWEQYEEARLRVRGPSHLYKRYRLNKWSWGLEEVAVKHVRFLDDVVQREPTGPAPNQ